MTVPFEEEERRVMIAFVKSKGIDLSEKHVDYSGGYFRALDSILSLLEEIRK